MANYSVKGVRTFIGAKDYNLSRSFYSDLGFPEKILNEKMSRFDVGSFGFYLQDYYVKDWIENSMILVDVDNVDAYWEFLQQLDLQKKYPDIRLIPIKDEGWARVCRLTDPSGVLWHFAQYS